MASHASVLIVEEFLGLEGRVGDAIGGRVRVISRAIAGGCRGEDQNCQRRKSANKRPPRVASQLSPPSRAAGEGRPLSLRRTRPRRSDIRPTHVGSPVTKQAPRA